MLVLSRKKNEAIVITGGIRVMVVEIRGDKVRLGIEAAREIQVSREELLTDMDPETRRALQQSARKATE